MGAGASSSLKAQATVEEELKLPADGSDVATMEEAKAEVVRLRTLLKESVLAVEEQNTSAGVSVVSGPPSRERFCANNYQVVIKEVADLERVVAAAADASGPACAGADTDEYCAGMSVRIDRVYRKHCYVDNNEGTRAWLPIETAFVDPATMEDIDRQCMKMDEPNVVGVRTLIGDPAALKVALVKASASHVKMFDETDFAALCGLTCKVIGEEGENPYEPICNLCVQVEETGYHYAFFAGDDAFQT